MSYVNALAGCTSPPFNTKLIHKPINLELKFSPIAFDIEKVLEAFRHDRWLCLRYCLPAAVRLQGLRISTIVMSD